MGHSTSARIAVPDGCDIRLFIDPAASLVVVAPPGLTADPSVMTQPGLTGLFTHDPGVDWPSVSGCAYAAEYLRCGHPIILRFEAEADARACHGRLLTEAGQ